MVSKYVFLFFVVTIGCVTAKSSNGEGCILRTSGEIGVCTNFKDCVFAKGESCKGILPQACPSYKEDSSVCCESEDCPPLLPGLVNIPLTGYKAWDYCASIAGLAYPCRVMNGKISRINACPQLPDPNETGEATLVKEGEYPHLVLLSMQHKDDVSEKAWSFVHVGTLISDKWVLTSASIANDEQEFAMVGGLNQGGTIYKIVNRVLHPMYKQPTGSSIYNDIALLELDKSVPFSKLVLPACLHTGNLLPEEKLKDIVGNTGFWSRDVEFISHEECANLYSGLITILPDGVDEFTQFCIRRTSGDDLKSIYGAPIQVYNGAAVACTQTVLGVFSNSMKEEHLITRVAPYITWIESVVWP